MTGRLARIRPLILAPALVLAGSLLAGGPALAQRDPAIPHAQDRPPGPALSPSEAIAKMTVPEGFKVELVAGEPDIVNPVAMTFDERGRAWITESLEYPRRSAGPGRDRVKILEDTDGDGKADKFTVFADGLNIPSGIAVGAGGVWVANSPDILFFKDNDGDGRADSREVVVTGFGREDTHELPNSLTWGPDGYLYGWNGVFNPAKIDYRGKHYEFTCAVFRIDPKTRDFEVFCEGTSNPWGIAWDLDGSAFASACVIDHLWHLTETGYYHRQGGPYPPFTWKLESIVGHKHQKAAYCGITYLDSDAFPGRYRGRMFMGNIHGNAINVDRLEKRGATYRAEAEPDFLQANDAWFMPVVQKVGPDGSLYVLDWYDRYHCYQDANRDPNGIDRLKGRLYRVRYEDTPRAPKFDLAKESDDQLIARLASPNIYYRDVAQRLLRERDHAEARPKLERLALDAKGDRKGRMHALWTLIGTGRLDPGVHSKILADPDPTIRAWGVRAAGNFRKVDDEVKAALVLMADDPSAEVLVQLAVAARKVDGLEPLSILIGVLDDEDAPDPILPQVVWQNLHPLLEARGAEFADLVRGMVLAESPRFVPLIPRAIDRLLAGPKAQPEAAAVLLGSLMAPEVQLKVEGEARRALEILADRLRGVAAPGSPLAARREPFLKVLRTTLEATPDSPLFLDAAIVATSWRDPAATRAVARALGSANLPEDRRLRAIDALISAGDPSTIGIVGPVLADPKAGSAKFRGELLAALGRLDSPTVAEAVLAAYPKLEPEIQPRAVELLTQRSSWTRALLDAVAAKAIPSSALNLNQVRKLAASKDAGLAGRVKAIWGTIREGRNPAREQVIDRMREGLKNAHGDPVAGAGVFGKVCGQCHKIYGEGVEVGPEITLNGRASYEQLLSNVFDPSLVIGPAYQALTVATRDGRVLTGLVVEDGPDRLALKLQGGKVETLAKSEIEERKLSPLSLMPEGIEGQMTDREMADLFAFITLDRPPTDPAAAPIPGTPGGIRK